MAVKVSWSLITFSKCFYCYEDRLVAGVQCAVCGDRSSGRHYRVFTCDGVACASVLKRRSAAAYHYLSVITCSVHTAAGCAGFFKRTEQEKRFHKYVCKRVSGVDGQCPIERANRNLCRLCRYRQCLRAGMDPLCAPFFETIPIDRSNHCTRITCTIVSTFWSTFLNLGSNKIRSLGSLYQINNKK